MTTLLLALALVFGCGGASDSAATQSKAEAMKKGAKPGGKVGAKAGGKGGAKGGAKAKARADVPKVSAKLFFIDKAKMDKGEADPWVEVTREVGGANPPRNAVWTLFKGPTAEESEKGLSLPMNGAEGFDALSITDGVATLKMRGGCTNEGGAITLYDAISKTLKQYPEVEFVKLQDPQGQTQTPEGKSDSRPACLEP